MFKHIFKLQIVRQLIGAGMGALIALVAYNGYTVASDAVQAYLLPPGSGRAAFTGDVRVSGEENTDMERITARAREAAQRLRATRQAMLGDAAVSSGSSVSSESSESAASSGTPVVAQMHGGAPALPSSGIGVQIAALAAMIVTAVSFGCVQMRMMAARRAVD